MLVTFPSPQRWRGTFIRLGVEFYQSGQHHENADMLQEEKHIGASIILGDSIDHPEKGGPHQNNKIRKYRQI